MARCKKKEKTYFVKTRIKIMMQFNFANIECMVLTVKCELQMLKTCVSMDFFDELDKSVQPIKLILEIDSH